MASSVDRAGPRPTRPPRPQGLFLLGSDGKVYTVRDPKALVEASETGVHGFGMAAIHAAMSVPGPEAEPEVAGRDMKFSYARSRWVYHRWLDWGWIYDEYGDWRYLYHYHPYGSAYAIYYR